MIIFNIKISKIENISHLNDLRVLNLASNLIKIVDNLNTLNSLIELNLKRNEIEEIVRNKVYFIVSVSKYNFFFKHRMVLSIVLNYSAYF